MCWGSCIHSFNDIFMVVSPVHLNIDRFSCTVEVVQWILKYKEGLDCFMWRRVKQAPCLLCEGSVTSHHLMHHTHTAIWSSNSAWCKGVCRESRQLIQYND